MDDLEKLLRQRALLTRREREVAVLVSEGLSNKEVGRRLNLSESTVKTHLHNIYNKIRVPNRTALTVVAVAQPSQRSLRR
jgi:two-component system, NarL family, nitrate/nitrite response regulator NarL